MSITNQIKYLENINDFSKVGLIYLENSGENLLRHYLEMIFHIKTGSNIKREYVKKENQIFELQDDVDSNWVVASDYPSRREDEYLPAEISSAILLIRNPVDLIMSKVLNESEYYDDAYNKIDQMIEDWKQFQKFWINAPIPVHLIRYEDLVLEPEEILKQTCKFLLGIKSIENTKLDHAITQVVSLAPNFDKAVFAYDIVVKEDYLKNITNELSDKIQQNFFNKLNKMLQKYNYELSSNGDIINWMGNFNRDNLVKMVEFQETLNNQFMTSTYTTIKLY